MTNLKNGAPEKRDMKRTPLYRKNDEQGQFGTGKRWNRTVKKQHISGKGQFWTGKAEKGQLSLNNYNSEKAKSENDDSEK